MKPFSLFPATQHYLWGGTKLIEDYNKNSQKLPLAETWECSIHPDGPSIVADGEYKGKTLEEVVSENPECLGTKNKEFPILVKLIDAKKELSIQVHPDDEYAMKNEGQKGKCEMWYILDAEPGASIVYGFAQDISAEQLKISVKNSELKKHLNVVKVKKGDSFYIPAGMIHAIGAGITLAEIQQNSNLTYRVYDYDRIDVNGNKRQLHLEKAIDVLDYKARNPVQRKTRLLKYGETGLIENLCICDFFTVEKIEMKDQIQFEASEDSFSVLLIIDGAGILNEELQLEKGRCIFIPAGNSISIRGRMIFLRISC